MHDWDRYNWLLGLHKLEELIEERRKDDPFFLWFGVF